MGYLTRWPSSPNTLSSHHSHSKTRHQRWKENDQTYHGRLLCFIIFHNSLCYASSVLDYHCVSTVHNEMLYTVLASWCFGRKMNFTHIPISGYEDNHLFKNAENSSEKRSLILGFDVFFVVGLNKLLNNGDLRRHGPHMTSLLWVPWHFLVCFTLHIYVLWYVMVPYHSIRKIVGHLHIGCLSIYSSVNGYEIRRSWPEKCGIRNKWK